MTSSQPREQISKNARHTATAALMLAAIPLLAEEPELIKRLKTELTLKVPESVLFVPGGRFLFVANVEGQQPCTRDGKGSIGNVIDVGWVTGLNGPKGMGLHGDLLRVAYIDHVVVIDAKRQPSRTLSPSMEQTC